MRVRYGPQAADIAQEMGADCAQAGALVDALFWLKQAQMFKRRPADIYEKSGFHCAMNRITRRI